MRAHRTPTQSERDPRLHLQAIARALRSRRRLRLSIRALWTACMVWSVGLIVDLLGLALPLTVTLGAAALTLCIGFVYAYISHPSLRQLAHGLDSFYQLNEQLGTTLEVTRRAPSNELEQRLIQGSNGLLLDLRRYLAKQPLLPWREVETLIAVGFLTLSLTIASRAFLPAADATVALRTLPPPLMPTATPQAAPTEQAVAAPDQGWPGPGAREAASAIADGLRDSGATRSAADALDRADADNAADALRELADQSDQLSDGARRDIASGLREAADRLRDQQPDLADRLEQQADALEQGGQAAEQALEDLAGLIEQLAGNERAAQSGDRPAEEAGAQAGSGQTSEQDGQTPGEAAQGNSSGGPGAGNQIGGESRTTQTGSTKAQGEALPLPQSEQQNGSTTSATGPQGPTLRIEAGGTGTTPSSTSNGGTQPLPGQADPLSIPPEYRDVVEEYFTPAQ
jgi:hypothetical protein